MKGFGGKTPGIKFPGRLPFLAANFLIGDIQTGIMPLMSIDFLLVEHWRSARAGIVLAFGSLVLLLFQPLAGDLADRLKSKRAFFFLLATFFAIGCLLLYGHPSFGRALVSQLFLGLAQGGVMPVLGAVAMGLVGSDGFPRVTGLAQGAGHAGSVFGAISVLLIANHGNFFAIFVYYALSALMAGAILMGVPKEAIDHDRAREVGKDRSILPISRVLTPALFLLFSVLLVFFVANTAMLPLAGDKLSGIYPLESPARVMAFLMLVTQAVMIPYSLLAPFLVRRPGTGPLFLTLCLLVLALRGSVLSESKTVGGILIGQFLDGTIMGFFYVLLPVIVAGLAKNTGRFNFLQGLSIAMISAGATLSQLISGHLLDLLGIDRTLLVLSGVALIGSILAIGSFISGFSSPAVDSGPDGSQKGESGRREDSIDFGKGTH